jgi:hypothetical protein
MRLYVQLGRRGAALRQYQVCAALLERELRAQPEPEPETKALYQQILTERPAVSPLVEEGFAAPDAARASASSPPAPAPASKSLDLLAADLPLVGREAELARLTELLERAWSGRGTIAAILGDPGVGKSRLAAEMAIQAAGRGGRVLVGRCFEIEQRLPFAAWVDALRGGDIPADGALIDSLAPVWRRELARILPELGEPVPPAPLSSDPLHLFEALARLLEALTRRAPLVILVEDGHWLDDMSLRLLPFPARRIRRWRLLWLGTFREEELAGDSRYRLIGDDLAREGLAIQLRLSPLSRSETIALVREIVPPGSPESVGEQVWRISEGNAFMVVETARTLADPRRGAASDPAVIPGRVRDLVGGRLERLSPGARRVVALAATIGRQFEFPLVREASGVAEDEVAEAMEELVRRRIFQPSGEGFEFTHDQIREVAYASLLLPQRAILHRQVADALERLHGAEAADVTGALAFHYRRAGAWAKAVYHLGRFAERAARGYAHGDAAEALQHALEALGRTPASRERDRCTWSSRCGGQSPCTSWARWPRAWRRSGPGLPWWPASTIRPSPAPGTPCSVTSTDVSAPARTRARARAARSRRPGGPATTQPAARRMSSSRPRASGAAGPAKGSSSASARRRCSRPHPSHGGRGWPTSTRRSTTRSSAASRAPRRRWRGCRRSASAWPTTGCAATRREQWDGARRSRVGSPRPSRHASAPSSWRPTP